MSKLKHPFLISVLPFGNDSDSLIKFPNLPNYPFLISILPAEEGEGYLIEFPDLPGCMSDGETIEETIENGRDAVVCWIETAKRYGDKIPQPGLTAHFASAKINFSNCYSRSNIMICFSRKRAECVLHTLPLR